MKPPHLPRPLDSAIDLDSVPGPGMYVFTDTPPGRHRLGRTFRRGVLITEEFDGVLYHRLAWDDGTTYTYFKKLEDG